MKKTLLFWLISLTAFADSLFLENKTSHPMGDQSQMSIQWAFSARQVQEYNQTSLQGEKLPSSSLKPLGAKGKVKVDIPKNAEYFRIVVWTEKGDHPQLLTNWVDVVADKVYKLQDGHLIPAVLMPGIGC